MADIDIDFANRQDILSIIEHIPALQYHNGIPRNHNSGVYVTDIPIDPFHNRANIDYKTAEERGYFKIDFLNMSVYQLVQSTQHYEKMLTMEPTWDRLYTDREWVQQLVHIGNYFELLRSMKPDSIPRLAAFISIIRPGKLHLRYKSWEEVFKTVWDNDGITGYIFKKSHAISYARLVTLHMNLLS